MKYAYKKETADLRKRAIEGNVPSQTLGAHERIVEMWGILILFSPPVQASQHRDKHTHSLLEMCLGR